MKCNRSLRILTVAVTLSLLMVLIPSIPALAAPIVTLSPTSGAIGTKVNVTGTNFESYAGDYVSVFFNSTEVGGEIVPTTGTFTLSFHVPDDTAAGRDYVTVKDERGNRLGEKRPFIVDEIEIELYPKDGTVGTTVAVNGRGFYASERITFYYDEAEVNVGNGLATLVGEVAYSFNVPESTVGNHEIKAQDILGNSAEVDFKVIPSVALSPVSGAMGDEITVNGSGFEYKSDVTICLDGVEVATGKTDKYGSFEAIFNVPVMKPGSYKIEVEDDDDNTTKAEFTIGAGVSLSPMTGSVGTSVMIRGTGFVGGETVTVTYNTIEIATATPDGNGTFSVAFNAPASIGGSHPIVITDGINIIKRAFTMESEAPPVPALLIPEEGVEVDKKVLFDWEDVTDDSLPVTYFFQIATDENFTSVAFEAEGLTDSEYTLPEERLVPTKKEAPYYWRVRAVDGASNESEWSSPYSFYIGTSFSVPIGVTYTLIVLGVLGLGLLTFWLGRRTAYRRQ